MLTQEEIAALSKASESARAYIANLQDKIGFTFFPTPDVIDLRTQLSRAQFDLENTDRERDSAIEGGDHELAIRAIEDYNTIASGGEVAFKTPLSNAIDGIKDALPTAQQIKDALTPNLPMPDLTWVKVTVVVIGLVALAYISRLFPRRAT